MTARTRVCTQCASPVAVDDEFCLECGDFLGWAAEPVPAGVGPPEPVERAEPEPAVAAEDLLGALQQAHEGALVRAKEATSAAAEAQVRLERVRRRATSATRRLERLRSELPDAERRAHEAERAAGRAAASARRAAGAKERAPAARREELTARAREAARAERRATKASRQAQEALATLSGVLQGAGAEVEQAPADTAAAKRARDAARREAAAASAEATAAAAALALQERLMRLRATPRRVVALPARAEQELREQAQRDADEAALKATRRAGASERKQLRRAEQEDAEREQAEQLADARELEEVLSGAEQATAAAAVAQFAEPGEGEQPRALTPVEVRRRARRQAVAPAVPEDGPVPCPSCGAGNADGRHLCRVCGARLRLEAEAPAAPPRVPWWWRLLRLGPPRGKGDDLVPAGARPVPGGNRRTAAAVRRARVGGASALRASPRQRLVTGAAAGAGVAVLAAVVLTPLGDEAVDAVRGSGERVREQVGLGRTPLVPLRTSASSTARTSAPALAFDGDPATSWTAGRAPGTGALLSISFTAPVEVVAVELSAAAGLGRPRPASVTVLSAGSAPVVLRLKDELGAQQLAVRLGASRTVRLQIGDVYTGSAPGLAAGFAEVQLLGRA